MKTFKNAKIYVEGQGIVKTSLTFGEKILSIGGTAKGEEIVLPNDAVVVPGFIDEHIHGAGGCDAMDANAQALSTVARVVTAEGTTSFLATTMTQSKENITKALQTVRQYSQSHDCNGAKVIGVHLEGPFISLKHIGAQPKEYVQTPCVELFDEYYSASGNKIKVVSLAPEEIGADKLIKHLAKNSVVVSIGHTDAGFADVERAVANGASCVTHTYNAQTGLHHREVGVVGSAMLFDELYTEIICDTIHVSVPAIKLLVKNKPHDKVILITDSMRAKGLRDGESELGGQTVYVKDGQARLKDGTLAGSVLKMNVAVKNMVEKVGVPFEEAIDFATANPARNLGIYGEVGSIAVGKRADLTVLDSNYNVLYTFVDGKNVYKA